MVETRRCLQDRARRPSYYNSPEEQQREILGLIKENRYITRAEIAIRLGVSVLIIDLRMAKLNVVRIGPANGGYWKVEEEVTPLVRRIDSLDLSTRAKNALNDEEIDYLYEVIEKTELELSKVPGLGQVSLTEIRDLLNSMNLPLGQPLDAETLYTLGVKFYEGEGVERNLQKTVKLWDRATELGQVDAQYSLAYLYSKGEGVKKDLQKAIELWTRAAEQGHKESQRSLDESCSSTYQ